MAKSFASSSVFALHEIKIFKVLLRILVCCFEEKHLKKISGIREKCSRNSRKILEREIYFGKTRKNLKLEEIV